MTFLSEVADYLLTHHQGELGNCTVVFPNRRAGMFLKKQLSQKVDKPVWSPEVKSLEDFIFRYSPPFLVNEISNILCSINKCIFLLKILLVFPYQHLDRRGQRPHSDQDMARVGRNGESRLWGLVQRPSCKHSI